MNYGIESVKQGKLIKIELDAKGEVQCAVPVLVTPSLDNFHKRAKINNPAALLLAALKRTLESYQTTGAKPSRLLKVYVSAKDNVYFESMTLPWDESEKPCLLFALPGQINLEKGYVTEMTAEAREKVNRLTPEEHEAIRKLAVAKAEAILEDPRSTEEMRRDARELLSMNRAFERRQKEQGN